MLFLNMLEFLQDLSIVIKHTFKSGRHVLVSLKTNIRLEIYNTQMRSTFDNGAKKIKFYYKITKMEELQ